MSKVKINRLFSVLLIGAVFLFDIQADAFFNVSMLRREIIPPKFIQSVETAWSTTASPKTTSSFNVEAGDVLVAYLIREGSSSGGSTISGGSLTWTQQVQVIPTNYTELSMWTAVVDTSKSMTVTFTRPASVDKFGGTVLTFRGSSGVGAVASTYVASGAPTLNITTVAKKSAVVVANGDWSGQIGARTWRLSPTELNFNDVPSAYVAYSAYHPNIGDAAAYAVGLSAPVGQKYAIGAIEVKGLGHPPLEACTMNVGSFCSDGSVYAGISTDGNLPMFTTPTDAGSYSWNNGNSTGTVATGNTSSITGAANTNALAPLDSDSVTGGVQPHQAAKHCFDLVAHGKSDWYLPSEQELNVLFSNRAAIGQFNTTGGEYGGSWYWSSTDNSSGDAVLQRFENGTKANWGKSYAKSVRCVRKN